MRKAAHQADVEDLKSNGAGYLRDARDMARQRSSRATAERAAHRGEWVPPVGVSGTASIFSTSSFPSRWPRIPTSSPRASRARIVTTRGAFGKVSERQTRGAQHRALDIEALRSRRPRRTLTGGRGRTRRSDECIEVSFRRARAEKGAPEDKGSVPSGGAGSCGFAAAVPGRRGDVVVARASRRDGSQAEYGQVPQTVVFS